MTFRLRRKMFLTNLGEICADPHEMFFAIGALLVLFPL